MLDRVSRANQVSIVDLAKTDSAAAEPGESATFDFGPTDLVIRARAETHKGVSNSAVPKRAVEAYRD